MDIAKNQKGQALTEYILLLAFVAAAYVIVINQLAQLKLDQKLMVLMSGSFSATYQYGHPLAKGFDNGGPIYHPRATGGDNDFRMFLNPQTQSQ